MAELKQRVVITGTGMINPLGQDCNAIWSAINQGLGGIIHTPEDLKDEVSCPVCGYVEDLSPSTILKNRKTAKLMGRDSLLGIKAAREALAVAGFNNMPEDQDRFGLYVSTGLTYGSKKDIFPLVNDALENNGVSMKAFGTVSLNNCNPLLSFKILPNMPACHISIELGLTGPNMVLNPRPVQGAQAIGEAFQAIGDGLLDQALVGSLDSRLHLAGIQTMNCEGVIYDGGNQASEASRPFDKMRKGIIPSEGAAFLVLESLDSATQRNARIYAEVIAYGQSSALTSDEESYCSAAFSAMEKTLSQGQIDISDIDLLYSSAASCPINDQIEGIAIKKLIGTSKTKIWCPKAFYGELGASSLSTAVVLAGMSLSGGIIPPSINLDNNEFSLPFTKKSTVPSQLKYCLINACETSPVKASILLGRVLK
ncbi:MAG: hypothetical protein CVU89_04540 [Firmicutes bacterium HGW-Firmicutes-14]|nr:MAG: hypothetical protein CVU89_04540 [Firmicutes bacterium HGW-Firmicutes-14]